MRVHGGFSFALMCSANYRMWIRTLQRVSVTVASIMIAPVPFGRCLGLLTRRISSNHRHELWELEIDSGTGEPELTVVSGKPKTSTLTARHPLSKWSRDSENDSSSRRRCGGPGGIMMFRGGRFKALQTITSFYL